MIALLREDTAAGDGERPSRAERNMRPYLKYQVHTLFKSFIIRYDASMTESYSKQDKTTNGFLEMCSKFDV